MAGEQEEHGEAYTLGLLRELRELCTEAAQSQNHYARRFHDLLHSISSSNTPDVAKELTFRVEGYLNGTREHFRTISLNGNAEVARAAYETTKKLFPNDRWLLIWGGYVMEDSKPIKDWK